MRKADIPSLSRASLKLILMEWVDFHHNSFYLIVGNLWHFEMVDLLDHTDTLENK